METREDAELGSRIKEGAVYFEAPQDLRDRVGLILSQTPAEQLPAGRWPEWRRWWGMGAAFAMGVVLSVALVSLYGLPGSRDRLVEQVVASHVRSLMVAHLSDVTSSDRHTVKPWLSRQLGFSPPVPDLAAEGFPLVGGRLDYIDDRPVAALVYQRQLHSINLFVWPSRRNAAVAATTTSRQGFNVRSWDENGMQFWAVSDLSSTELERFATLLSARTASQRLP